MSGAPQRSTSCSAAEEEIAFAQSLCDHPPNTLLALNRTVEDGAIREAFRTLHRKVSRLDPATAFRFVAVEEEATPAEEVDIVALAAGRK